MTILILHEALAGDARLDERDVLDQVDLVKRALEAAGHCVCVRAVAPELDELARALEQDRPLAVFNLVESLGGRAERIHEVPGLLERLGVPFTGAPSRALGETSDKLATKRRLRALGLPTPEWCAPGDPARPTRADEVRAWIAKPVCEDGSVGIDDFALFSCAGRDVWHELRAREIRAGRPLFAEAYVEGREFNLSLLAGDGEIEALPAAEILFEDYPCDKPRIVGYRAKWEVGSFEHGHTPRRFVRSAEDAPLLRQLVALARACFLDFGLRGYGRVDFRVDRTGAVWILEVNANPCLAADAGFLAAAAAAGLTPARVVARLLRDAQRTPPSLPPSTDRAGEPDGWPARR